MKHAATALLVCLSTTAGHVLAGDMYFLGSMGSASYGSGTQTSTDAELARLGRTVVQSSLGSGAKNYKIILGYQVNPYMAFEGGYYDLGVVNYNATFTGGSISVDSKATAMGFSLVGISPLNYQTSVLAKIGYTIGTIKSSGSTSGTTVSTTQDKNSISFGFGGVYNITPTLGVRAEWEKPYDDVNLISVGLQAKF
ncbi:outer membrane beta-barrel protein [Rhodoferax aquaticus]|nr:outer membrane beta-barrel protein [Rhodoferax aquaticus]